MKHTDVLIAETLETACYFGIYIFFCFFKVLNKVHVQCLMKLVICNYLYIDCAHGNKIINIQHNMMLQYNISNINGKNKSVYKYCI
jgi:hypothetical protein